MDTQSDLVNYADYISYAVNSKDNWEVFLQSLLQLKLIEPSHKENFLTQLPDPPSAMNLFFEWIEGRVYILHKDNGLTNLGLIYDLVSFADSNVQTDISICDADGVIEINPMPKTSYFFDKFAPEKVFFKYKNMTYQLNWNMYFSETLEGNEFIICFANYILEVLGSPNRLYLLADTGEDEINFLLSLDYEVFERVNQNEKLPFINPDCNINLQDYQPLDLTEQIDMVSPVFNKLIKQKSYCINNQQIHNFSIPNTQSMTSAQSQQWFDEQINNIKCLYKGKVLPEPFEQLSYKTDIEKLGQIFNVFIAITRQLIADPRVIDRLYKRQRLLSSGKYEKLVKLLKKNKIFNTDDNIEDDTDILMSFLFNKDTLNQFLCHRYTVGNQLVNSILAQASEA